MNRLPREEVWTPGLSELKEHLDDTQPYGLVLGSAVKSRELDLIPIGPFHLKILHDYMFYRQLVADQCTAKPMEN